MNTKSQKATMAPTSANVDGLKCVKNANVFQENGVYFCRHYDTIIFAYDPSTSKCEVNWHCSTTSDRMIRNCLSFFNVDESKIVNTHDGDKWNYSGPITQ